MIGFSGLWTLFVLSLSLLLFFQVNELGFNINIECKIKDANKQASTCKCARVNICPMHIF